MRRREGFIQTNAVGKPLTAKPFRTAADRPGPADGPRTPLRPWQPGPFGIGHYAVYFGEPDARISTRCSDHLGRRLCIGDLEQVNHGLSELATRRRIEMV